MSSATAPPSNCEEIVCSSKVDLMKNMMRMKVHKDGKTKPKTFNRCPPDREELGRHTWTLLHTTAAYFPDEPTSAQKAAAIDFVTSLSALYPCDHCASDFRSEISRSPPECVCFITTLHIIPTFFCSVTNRESFSLWMCRQHNAVSKKIHKPLFDCTLEKLDRRYRSGEKGCFVYDTNGKLVPDTAGDSGSLN